MSAMTYAQRAPHTSDVAASPRSPAIPEAAAVSGLSGPVPVSKVAEVDARRAVACCRVCADLVDFQVGPTGLDELELMDEDVQRLIHAFDIDEGPVAAGAAGSASAAPSEPLVQSSARDYQDYQDYRDWRATVEHVRTTGSSVDVVGKVVVGALLDCEYGDAPHIQWRVARVETVTMTAAVVHYLGWSKQFDEIIPVGSTRLQPLGSRTAVAWTGALGLDAYEAQPTVSIRRAVFEAPSPIWASLERSIPVGSHLPSQVRLQVRAHVEANP